MPRGERPRRDAFGKLVVVLLFGALAALAWVTDESPITQQRYVRSGAPPLCIDYVEGAWIPVRCR